MLSVSYTKYIRINIINVYINNIYRHIIQQHIHIAYRTETYTYNYICELYSSYIYIHILYICGKNLKRIFPSHEALVDSSGRADAATAERGDDNRCKDSQPGQECQPTLLERRASLGCPPRRRQTDLLIMSLHPLQQRPEASTRVDTDR